MRDVEEDCVAIGGLRTVNFVNGKYKVTEFHGR